MVQRRIRPRRQRLVEKYVPPTVQASEQKIKTFHTKELFGSASNLFEDVAQAVLKNVQKQTGQMALKTARGLNSLRDVVSTADRVKYDVTHGKLLQEAIDNEDDMATLNRLTGQNLSNADARTIKKYIDQFDQANPLQNHVAHTKALIEEKGAARLVNGRVVDTGIGKRFKETTGKDFNSLMPEKITNKWLNDRFKVDSENILSAGVASGSITYQQGLSEAARVLGKGTDAYERAKLKMFNGLHSRLAKNRANKEDKEGERIAALLRTDMNFYDIAEGPGVGKTRAEQTLRNNLYVSQVVGETKRKLESNKNPALSASDIVELHLMQTRTEGVPIQIRDRISDVLKNAHQEILKPGFDVFVESSDFYTKIKRKKDFKTPGASGKLDSASRVAHFNEYYSYYSSANNYVPGFSGMSEEEKGVVVGKIREATKRFFRGNFDTDLGDDSLADSEYFWKKYKLSLDNMIVLGMAEAGVFEKEGQRIADEIRKKLDNYYEFKYQVGQAPTKEEEARAARRKRQEQQRRQQEQASKDSWWNPFD